MPSIDLMYAKANGTVLEFRERKARNRRNWWQRVKADPDKYQEELRKAAARYQKRKQANASPTPAQSINRFPYRG